MHRTPGSTPIVGRGATVETRATPEAEGVRASVRALLGEQRFDEAWALLRPLVTGDGERGVWDLARTVLGKGAAAGWTPPAARQIRLGILCSYEGAELAAHLELACRALRMDVAVYAAPFGQ